MKTITLALKEEIVLHTELSALVDKYVARSREMTKDPLCTTDILNDTLDKCESLRGILTKIDGKG